eukprot:TRINITY_DN7487_c0_g2_i1.p1 TRINITY_DN7487_c0_g2~~TRINITY_DN7487_c0_g2_i1.p1  ORF type:complete len:252 (+),score=55.36 TRINITY_DN7487_c0_g2_i1:724-1479(+)
MHRYFYPEFIGMYAVMMDMKGNLVKTQGEVKRDIHHGDIKLVLKIIAQVKDSNRLQVCDASKRKLIKYKPEYTGIHTLVFENLMEPPLKAGRPMDNYGEWVSSYSAWKGNWILVDVDNYLNGNDYYCGRVSQREFKNAVLKVNQSEAPELPENIWNDSVDEATDLNNLERFKMLPKGKPNHDARREETEEDEERNKAYYLKTILMLRLQELGYDPAGQFNFLTKKYSDALRKEIMTSYKRKADNTSKKTEP